jgi:hypothetical protein
LVVSLLVVIAVVFLSAVELLDTRPARFSPSPTNFRQQKKPLPGNTRFPSAAALPVGPSLDLCDAVLAWRRRLGPHYSSFVPVRVFAGFASEINRMIGLMEVLGKSQQR